MRAQSLIAASWEWRSQVIFIASLSISAQKSRSLRSPTQASNLSQTQCVDLDEPYSKYSEQLRPTSMTRTDLQQSLGRTLPPHPWIPGSHHTRIAQTCGQARTCAPCTIGSSTPCMSLGVTRASSKAYIHTAFHVLLRGGNRLANKGCLRREPKSVVNLDTLLVSDGQLGTTAVA
jgi:hypothetical protein